MRQLTERVKNEWSLKKFKVVVTDEKLAPSAGLEAVLYNFDQSLLSKKLLESLPERKSNASCGSKTYAYMFLLGFMEGFDSIEQLEEFQDDYFIEDFLESKIPCPKACANFLKDFDEDKLDKLNKFMRNQARVYRSSLNKVHGFENELILDIDSTKHVQSGKQFEGLEVNYDDGSMVLDSLVAWDQRGFCHGMNLRAGATHSSVGGPALIDHGFEGLDSKIEKFVRADSAYCNQEFIESCLRNKAKFTITAHDNIHWSAQAHKLTEWETWEYNDEQKNKALKQDKALPKIELSKYIYFPGWADKKLAFPVIIKRTQDIKNQGTLFESFEWKYYAVITNFNLFTTSLQEVMMFHQGRANCENMIREEKHNYDLLHFPVKELKANHAYGLFALIAHNLLRHTAFLIKPDKPMFAKKIRRGYIQIPGKVVSHARQLFLKVSKNFIKEVTQLREALSLATYEASWNTS